MVDINMHVPEGRDLERDLGKLAQAFFKHLRLEDCEFGGIGIDPKKPFGNSAVESDILNIIGWESATTPEASDVQINYASDLYRKALIPYLQEQYTDSGLLSLF